MKKVLIITYYWPPSGGGGVQRWLKFVKYLPSYGWQPIVIAPENPEYPVLDKTLEANIPPEAVIYKFPIWEPYGIFKKLTGREKNEKVNTGLLFDEKKQTLKEKASLWIRGNILLPDPRVFWVKPTYKHLKKLIPEINPDALITTGTPHSVHLIGLKLKKYFRNLFWLADLRDPWSDLDMLDKFYASRLARKHQKKLERKVLNKANVVTTVSPAWANELQQKTITPVKCITNGFDDEDFLQKTSGVNSKNFTLSHVGIINSYRNPESLWSAIEELCQTNSGFNAKFNLKIIGISDKGLENSLIKYPALKEKTAVTGYIPHSEVIEKYGESHCLLLLLNNTKNSKGHIPGKFFEYLASGKPILAIGPTDSDVSNILRETKAGHTCEFDDKEGIKTAIQTIFNNSNENTDGIISDAVKIYNRKNLTGQLIRLLKQ